MFGMCLRIVRAPNPGVVPRIWAPVHLFLGSRYEETERPSSNTLLNIRTRTHTREHANTHTRSHTTHAFLVQCISLHLVVE